VIIRGVRRGGMLDWGETYWGTASYLLGWQRTLE